MISKEKFQLGYQYFYRKEYGNEKYVFKLTDNSSKLIDKFLVMLKEHYKKSFITLGENFIFNYYCFQFEFWNKAEREVSNFSEKVVPSLIFNKKALEKYTTRDQEWDWLFSDSSDYAQLKGIKRREFIRLIEDEKKKISSDFYRKLNHGTELGLDNCILYTDLFNNKNYYCITCPFKKECKELLRVNLPELYKNRGYGNQEVEDIKVKGRTKEKNTSNSKANRKSII